MSRKVLLFNPRSANSKPRIPNSVLQVAASIDGKWDWVIVDGNLEADPWAKIEIYLASGEFFVFGCTVMPGPQLKQAIPFTHKVKQLFPDITTVWGGYFPSNQSRVVMESGIVDYAFNGMADKGFPDLLFQIDKSKYNRKHFGIDNLIFKEHQSILGISSAQSKVYDPEKLPSLPYAKLNGFYPLEKYLGKTYLGTKTIAYHSSFGCPFTCSFCAVVPVYKAAWKAMSAQRIYQDILYLKEKHGGNAIEFHDNNFFVSEKRVVEFAQLIKPENMVWWGEARIDTMDKYKDESLQLIREAGCKMIFFGAETGNDAVLKKMRKGGTQTAEQILRFAERLKKFDIIPEYSFVLGIPGKDEEEVNRQIDEDIAFIRKVKSVNPDTEIIIYVYSPVPTPGSEMYEAAKKRGFKFPETLEDWISPHWEKFDLRKNPLTPWLKPYMISKIRNFETVLNGYYPTVSDLRLSSVKRSFLRNWSSLRYKTGFYTAPYGIKALQKVWKYRQPETEGF